MMFETFKQISCDVCGLPDELNSDGTVRDMRKELRLYGWTYENKKDYCPSCSAKRKIIKETKIMTTTKYKLAIIPEGYKAVPEEPNEDQKKVLSNERTVYGTAEDLYSDLIKAAPQLDKPPVLRWEGDVLMIYGHPLAYIHHLATGGAVWYLNTNTPQPMGNAFDYILARRAAEKALGFPDGLVVEAV